MSLRDQLQTIYDRHHKLTPELVLNEARDPEHSLHHRFEWADDVAAEKWRRHQAHELITSVRIQYVTNDGEPRDVRAFHAIRRENGHVFEPLEQIAQDPITRQILRADMERQCREMVQRMKNVDGFFDTMRQLLAEADAADDAA